MCYAHLTNFLNSLVTTPNFFKSPKEKAFLHDISYLKIHFDFQGHYFSALFTVFENVENIILHFDENLDLKMKVNQGQKYFWTNETYFEQCALVFELEQKLKN